MQPQASPNRKAADAENCCKCRRRERLGPFDPQGAAALAGFLLRGVGRLPAFFFGTSATH